MQSWATSWQLIGRILKRAVENMEREQDHDLNFTSNFNSICGPTISITCYLNRIQMYANCSDSCYILAFIYIDRLLQNNPWFVLSSRNVHRLILSAVVLAIKYLDDSYAENSTYAKIGGVSLSEINVLERDMIKLLGYNLFVDSEIYHQYVHELELQSQKIAEESIGEEIDCAEKYIKPITTVSSMTSIRTVPSLSEMTYE